MTPGGHDHRGYVAQTDAWKARAERAEKRVAELEEALEPFAAAARQVRARRGWVGPDMEALITIEMRKLLQASAALACPACGATTEAECQGLEDMDAGDTASLSAALDRELSGPAVDHEAHLFEKGR